jgi:hypothetical protein
MKSGEKEGRKGGCAVRRRGRRRMKKIEGEGEIEK